MRGGCVNAADDRAVPIIAEVIVMAGHSRRYNTSVSVKTFDLYEEMEIPGNHLQTADNAQAKRKIQISGIEAPGKGFEPMHVGLSPQNSFFVLEQCELLICPFLDTVLC
jgi:hypothetical protein